MPRPIDDIVSDLSGKGEPQIPVPAVELSRKATSEAALRVLGVDDELAHQFLSDLVKRDGVELVIKDYEAFKDKTWAASLVAECFGMNANQALQQADKFRNEPWFKELIETNSERWAKSILIHAKVFEGLPWGADVIKSAAGKNYKFALIAVYEGNIPPVFRDSVVETALPIAISSTQRDFNSYIAVLAGRFPKEFAALAAVNPTAWWAKVKPRKV